jgi:flagellar basal body-associated protein FliL
MAAEAPKKPEAAPTAPAPAPADAKAAAPPKSGKVATFGIFGGIMIVEAVAIFMCMKLMGKEPDPTLGVEHGLVTTTKPWEESHELPVATVRVPNSNGSRTMLYNVKVVVRVNHKDQAKVKEFLENRKNTIEDIIGRVIRSADERHLGEPGMETLKRQVRFELNSLLGDEKTIEQVLIPECMPIPTGF